MVRMSKAFSMKSDWKYLEIGDSNFRICPHNWINVDRSMVRRARGNPTGSVHRSAVIIIIWYWRPQNRKPLHTKTTIVGNVDRSSEHVSQTEVKKRQHMQRNAYWRVQRVSWKLIINIYCQSNIIVNLNRRPIFNATFRINVWRPMVRLLRFCFHFIGYRFSDEAANQRVSCKASLISVHFAWLIRIWMLSIFKISLHRQPEIKAIAMIPCHGNRFIHFDSLIRSFTNCDLNFREFQLSLV